MGKKHLQGGISLSRLDNLGEILDDYEGREPVMKGYENLHILVDLDTMFKADNSLEEQIAQDILGGLCRAQSFAKEKISVVFYGNNNVLKNKVLEKYLNECRLPLYLMINETACPEYVGKLVQEKPKTGLMMVLPGFISDESDLYRALYINANMGNTPNLVILRDDQSLEAKLRDRLVVYEKFKFANIGFPKKESVGDAIESQAEYLITGEEP